MTKSNYLGLVLVAISLLLVTEINCQCYDIIDQYYSCKNLKMVHTTCSFYDTAVPYSSDNNNTGSNCIYEPDSSIPNNKLTDSFYCRKKFDKMSFNEAMNLFKKIYDEIDGCTTEFCECVQKRSFYPVPYDIYFRDDDTFKDVKKIIKAYNEKYQSRMLPYEEIKYNFPQGGSKILQKFCAKYDFTNIRLYTYKDVTKCFKDYDPNTFYDCEYEVKVVNKSLQLNYTNDQQIKRLKCFLLGKTKCPKELQRFYLLSIWSGEAPNVTFTQRSLISFFDSIIKEAKHYKPKITFGTISLSSYGNITSLISYSNGWSMYNGTESKFNKTCFSSNQLKIDCFWEFSHNESNPMSLMRVDFEFIFDKSLSYNLSVNVPSLLDTSSSSIKNETVKDNQGQNWLEFISSNSSSSLEVYDFNSNINIMLFIYDVYLNAPKDLLKSGSGVFVNGFTNN